MSIHWRLVSWGQKSRLSFKGLKSCLDDSVRSGEAKDLSPGNQEVDDAVRTLEYRHKQVITYHYVRGYSKERAARMLGMYKRTYISIFDAAIEKLEILL